MLRTLGPRSVLAFCALALLLLGGCSAAAPPIEPARPEVKPLVADLHRDHGWAAVRAERYKEAASYFQRILKDLPDDGQARLGLAEAYLGQGRLGDALEQFERLDGEPNTPLFVKSQQGRGIVYLRQGEPAKAKKWLELAVEKDDGLWRSWNALGRVRDADKDFTAARRAYRKAIDLNPKAAFLHNNLGFSLSGIRRACLCGGVAEPGAWHSIPA